MTLSVVGAGLGRTGTLSLKLALEHLGFGPCYHTRELLASGCGGTTTRTRSRRVDSGDPASWMVAPGCKPARQSPVNAVDIGLRFGG